MNAKVIEQYIEWAMSFEEWREPSLEKPHRILLWATMCVYARATEFDLCSFKDKHPEEREKMRERLAGILYRTAEICYGVKRTRFSVPNPYHNNISAWAIQKLTIPSDVEETTSKKISVSTGSYALRYLAGNIRKEEHGHQIQDSFSYLFPEVNPAHYQQAMELAEIMYGEE